MKSLTRFGRQKDMQRAKTYRWNHKALFNVMPIAQDRKEIADIIAAGCAVYGIRPVKVRYSTQAKSTAHYSPHNREIMLHARTGSWTHNHGVVLHELAHAITDISKDFADDLAWHGAEFCGILINLLAEVSKMDRAEMVQSAKTFRVQYDIAAAHRDADSVPAPEKKVAREPMSATGINPPTRDGACLTAWTTYSDLLAAEKEVDRSVFIAAAIEAGVQKGTASTQFGRWRRYFTV